MHGETVKFRVQI